MVAIASHPAPIASRSGLALNQRFVEALMGFRDGWTALLDGNEFNAFAVLEMLLSRKSQRLRGKR